ncbi:transposable element Tcb1 transposase [Trichonephila clavipes]|nr:transposable element Tcb1 transposase [Trichonephila clavipes]
MRIIGTLNNQHYISELFEPVVLPYMQLLPSSVFQQANVRPHVTRNVQEFFVINQNELLPWLACSPDLLPIINVRSMLAQRLTRDTPIICCYTRLTLAICGKRMETAVPQ